MDFEAEILNILGGNPDTPYSAKQIGRMLDRQLFREDPHWAQPHLELMVYQRRIQCDANGYWFRVKEEFAGAR